MRTKQELELLHARIIAITKADPELSPTVIATRCGTHANTVRDVQRKAGLYVRRGPSGSIPTQTRSNP